MKKHRGKSLEPRGISGLVNVRGKWKGNCETCGKVFSTKDQFETKCSLCRGSRSVDSVITSRLHCCSLYYSKAGLCITDKDIGSKAACKCKEQDGGQLEWNDGDYSRLVNFCPYCGYEARVKIKIGR